MQKIGTLGQYAARDIAYLISPYANDHATGRGHLKLEIDDRERRAIERSLAERRSHLIEKAAGDTTLTPQRGLSVARKALVDGVWADAKMSLYITFRIN